MISFSCLFCLGFFNLSKSPISGLCAKSWGQWWRVCFDWSSRLPSQVAEPRLQWKSSESVRLYGTYDDFMVICWLSYMPSSFHCLFNLSLNYFALYLFQVFFYRGELHILPCPSKSSPVGFSKDVVPSVAQALALLYTHPNSCQANPKICSALKKRLEGWENAFTIFGV